MEKIIDAIPCFYNGQWYRSKYEKKVAMLLKELHANFEYEPQVFDLGDGLFYKPDFKIKNNKGIGGEIIWIEAKGSFAYGLEYEEKILRFSKKHPILVVAPLNSNKENSFMPWANALAHNPWFLDGSHFVDDNLFADLWDVYETPIVYGREICPWNLRWVTGENLPCLPITDGENFYLEAADFRIIKRMYAEPWNFCTRCSCFYYGYSKCFVGNFGFCHCGDDCENDDCRAWYCGCRTTWQMQTVSAYHFTPSPNY